MWQRLQPWQVAALLVLLCLGVTAGVFFVRERTGSTPAELVSFLPRDDATVVFIDVGALRQSGLLKLVAGSKAAEDLEYKDFLDQTNFDYRRDLDAVAAAFQGDQVFFVLRGRFDWKKLITYAGRQGGSCRNSFCRVASSKPNRRISFFPLQVGLMGLAISPDQSAAYDLAERGKDTMRAKLPAQPVWVSFPASALRKSESFPAGTQSFAAALSTAESVVLSAGARDNRLEVLLDVRCQSEAAATDLRKQLMDTTDLLKRMLERERKKPNPTDLSGVLSAGVFQQEARNVRGSWPVERSFVEAVAGNGVE